MPTYSSWIPTSPTCLSVTTGVSDNLRTLFFCFVGIRGVGRALWEGRYMLTREVKEFREFKEEAVLYGRLTP